MFKKATKAQAKLRQAIIGPAGSGKTLTALKLAVILDDKIAYIDTERGSASKYADQYEFDVLELETFSPENYIQGINEAQKQGYNVLIIDSLSHAWTGKDGILDQVDKETLKAYSGNAFTNGWRKATPKHNALIDAILQANMHVIVTMRTKTEYIIEEDSKGKKVPRKIGLAPIQRDGLEYEFDIVGDMDFDHNFIVSKTRCPQLSGQIYPKPGEELGKIILNWLTTGVSPEKKLEEKEQQTINIDSLLELFGKLAFSEEFVDYYKEYLRKKYGKMSVSNLSGENLVEQFTLLNSLLKNNNGHKEKFQSHLLTFKLTLLR